MEPAAPAPHSFQARVTLWLKKCFNREELDDIQERCFRFFEESTELVQAKGMSRQQAHQLVDYVYDRPVGDPEQEVGGVQLTLAALCNRSGINMQAAAELELARVWGKIDVIRAKQAAKPRGRALPGYAGEGRIYDLVRRVGQQFRYYERQHRAKGTADADQKAEVNREMAERCEEALREAGVEP